MQLTVLDVNDIPSSILEEIKGYYSNLDFSNYGTIDENTKSRRLEYNEVWPLTEEKVIINPVTFDEETVDGSTHHYVRCFMVRAVFNEEISTADIRSVQVTGNIIAPKK